MKTNKALFALLILALVLVGFLTVDFDSNQASVVSLPDFDTEVQASQNKALNNLQDLNDAIVEIAEKTNPTVVTISTTQTIRAPRNPLNQFFRDPGGERPEREVTGLGSGVIVSEDGYILTNNHVVEGAEEITVETYDGSSIQAEIVGTDPQTDIAVLKTDAKNMPAIEFGNSDALRVGEFVLAIGSPFQDNLAHSVSFGIVSGKGRGIGMGRRISGAYEDFIQTDAAINPGNSGGALINLDGQLVGINTAIASQSGGNQGVGFAIPANMARNVMTQLIETGEVQRGYLGIFGETIDRPMARALDLEKPQGVIVGTVQQDGPAAEAGLQEGDIIRTLNGNTIRSYNAFRTEIASKSPGTEVTLGIIRDGDEQKLTVKLGELPNESGESGGPQQEAPGDQDMEENLGFSIQNLTPQIAEQLSLQPDQKGVVVTGISPRSNAYRQGLREGDVITSIDRQQVQDVGEFNEIMNQLMEEESQTVLLRFLRNGIGMFLAFDIN